MQNSDSSHVADVQARDTDFDAKSYLTLAIELGYDPRRHREGTESHIVVGLRFLAEMRAAGIVIAATNIGLYASQEGSWVRVCKKWLAAEIERACISLNINSNCALIDETRAWLMRQPELWHDQVPRNAGW